MGGGGGEGPHGLSVKISLLCRLSVKVAHNSSSTFQDVDFDGS